MGVFRPIRWEVTGKSRIAPDGVCAWMEGGEVVVATETWGAGELETAFNGQTARCGICGDRPRTMPVFLAVGADVAACRNKVG